MANQNSKSCAIGEGTLPLFLSLGKSSHIINLNNVQYKTDISQNILSVRKFNTQFRSTIILNDNGFIFSRKLRRKISLLFVANNLIWNSRKTLSTKISEEHFLVSNKIKLCNVNSISKRKKRNYRKYISTDTLRRLISEGDLMAWHKRMGHISSSYLGKLWG